MYIIIRDIHCTVLQGCKKMVLIRGLTIDVGSGGELGLSMVLEFYNSVGFSDTCLKWCVQSSSTEAKESVTV